MEDPAEDDLAAPTERPEPSRPAPRPAPGAGPGRRAQQASRSDYTGCGLWAGGFLLLIIVSFAVGVILRPDSDATDGSEAVTLADEVAGDGSYELVGRTDEVGEPCLTLRHDGDEVTGQCGFAPAVDDPSRYVVTSSTLDDGATVTFAPVDGLAEQVRLTLVDGSEEVVEVRRSETLGFSWFMAVTDAGIEGSAEILGSTGEPLRPGDTGSGGSTEPGGPTTTR